MGLADHDTVVCKLNCTELDLKPQFRTTRHFSKLNFYNIMPLININIQSMLSCTDPNIIVEKLNTGLNKIAEKLFGKTKIQRKTEEKTFDDPELRQERK